MDYRTGTRLTRAMLDGEQAFFETLARAPGAAEGLAAFAKREKLQEWFAPLARAEDTRGLLPEALRTDLAQALAEAPGRTRDRIALCEEVRDALAADGVSCLFLKGLAIGTRFYGDPTRRHQFDVDVLVRPTDFDAALRTLERLGFDVDAERAARRRQRIGAEPVRHAPQTVTVRRREKERIDLHVRTKSRWFHGLDESAYWRDRRPFTIDGRTFETLSDEHALLLLLVSIAADLRRGALRGKHLLDLHRMLCAFEPTWDWDRFLTRTTHRRLRKTLVNVLALHLTLWEAADALPRLAHALGRRRRLVELRGLDEALELVALRGQGPETRAWYKRMGSRTPLDHLLWRYGSDLPHTLRRGLERLHPGARAPWQNA